MDFGMTVVFLAFLKILSAPVIVIGALNCFFGYKLFRIMCAINGFLVGAILGAVPGVLAGVVEGNMDGGFVVFCALVCGAIGAVLSYAVQLIAVFFSCFGIGAFLGALLMILSQDYSEIFQGAMIGGLVFGVLGVLMVKTMIILQTTINGALQIGLGFLMFTQSLPSAGIAVILFFVLGLVVQYRDSGQKATVHSVQPGQGKVMTPEAGGVSVPVTQAAEQGAPQAAEQGAPQAAEQSVPQAAEQSVPQEAEQSASQEAKQAARRDREQEIQEMAQKAQRVVQETKSTVQKTLKKAKEDSGKYIDIAAGQGKKAEAVIEKGILLLQKNIENIWEYFEKNKKAFFPIMCAALVVASVIALL